MTHPTVNNREGKPFVRLTFKVEKGGTVTIWAIKLAPNKYQEVTREGDVWIRDGNTKHFVITKPTDIVSEEHAHLNLHYVTMEVT